MKPIGIGFVGAGWMGTAQLRHLTMREDVRLLALFEPNRQRSLDLLAELGLPQSLAVDRFEQMLENPAVDAVWLVSPNCYHGPQSLAAMAAGKHVFCEKPCATRFEDYQRQVAMERRNPRLFTFVDYILYFDTFEQRLRQMIADGVFGTISQLQVNYRYAVNITGDKTWKLRKEVVGDAIGMAINHALSVMILAMQPQGVPVAVYATSLAANTRNFEVPPVWNIQVRFSNGASGLCLGNIDHANGYDAYHSISGDRGGLIFDSLLDRPQKVRCWSKGLAQGKWYYPLDAARCRTEGIAELAWPADTTTPDSGDVIRHQIGGCIGHFLDCVKSGRRSPLSFEASSIISEVGWAAQLSAATRREVSLPLSAHDVEQLEQLQQESQEQSAPRPQMEKVV